MQDNEQTVKMANAIGPYYDVGGLSSHIGKSDEEISEGIVNHDILSAVTADDIIVFPVWQFEEDGTVNKNLREAAKILYSAELGSYYAEDGSMLAGAGWFALSFLTLPFPFSLPDGSPDPSYKGAEKLPLYRHLQQGSFVPEIMWEIEDQHHRMTAL